MLSLFTDYIEVVSDYQSHEGQMGPASTFYEKPFLGFERKTLICVLALTLSFSVLYRFVCM